MSSVTTASTTPEDGTTVPTIRVESGNPSPEDLAVVVALLSAAGGGDGAAAPPRPSAWHDPSWRLVGPAVGRAGWAGSALPR